MNKSTVIKLPKSLVEVRVEVSVEELAVFEQKALDEIAKEVEVSGFRKGTAPRDVVKNKVGQQKIIDRATMMAIEATFPAAVAEHQLEPLGYPEVSILKQAEGNPLEYKAVVAVYPQTELPDYKRIAAGFARKEAEVTQEDIKRLKMEKERHLQEHLRQDILAAVAEKTVVEIPDVLIERETGKMMSQLKERTPQVLHLTFDEYLKKLGKTEAELAIQMAKDNEVKIKNYLVLAQIAKQEKIEPDEGEVEAAINKARESADEGEAISDEEADGKQVNPASAESSGEAREYYRETLRTEKTFEFLENQFKK